MQRQNGLTEMFAQACEQLGMRAFTPNISAWPDVVVLDSKRSLLAVDVVDETIEPRDRTATVSLNRKISNLRDDIPMIADLQMVRRVLMPGSSVSGTVLLGADDVAAGIWLEGWPQVEVSIEALDEVERKLTPALQFAEVPIRAVTDAGADARADRRLVLDSRQADIATRTITDVAILRGPPGSGKTLVLAARARWLAQNNPNWVIQILCFNRLLVPYLRSLVEEKPNVHVSTFGRFARAQGHSLNLSEEAKADADLQKSINRGIVPTLDALLIDEWQDFLPAWTTFAFATLRPHRGGALLAGDRIQALYWDADNDKALAERAVEEIDLTQPYRCTAPILHVAEALDPAYTVTGIDDAPDGEPVDLVWADSPRDQADAVAADVKLLLADDRRLDEIGILVTYKRLVGAVCHALADRDIPYRLVKSSGADDYQHGLPAVTVMTVHSAKGYEFAVVFLVGLEGLPRPDTAENARWGRVGYVGATRARDQLVITYSKDGHYLDRLRALPNHTRRWTWPDDYPEGA
ncbi:ATP-binding domain-containing protein [Actinoplanes bogorensis]|uniref:ATP-binding domain-containing protein n=1 Tax=Paractinoplanes bogorensis TaxID=1610840 RepID=A0ABS5YK20_9ACTN|nr:3'-5' exonuclease [Actinoplanes bogorensis]MBU2663381.1 ATP-binding domain-containing protein [Actinoplanes bogorensis]